MLIHKRCILKFSRRPKLHTVIYLREVRRYIRFVWSCVILGSGLEEATSHVVLAV